MPEWTAEVVVDEEGARSLIAAQFPPLPERSLRLLAVGWDNSVFVVDEAVVFRFPRRRIALPGIETETAVLPRIAPLVPVPIPVPTYLGRPTDAFPWPFYGAPLVPGSESCDLPLADAERASLARPLARLLRTLHAPAVVDAIGARLREDPNARADMGRRVPRALEQLEDAARRGLWTANEHVRRLLEAARRLPPPKATAVCHGDLHFRHVLLDERRRLSGLIDWGDVCRADPAIDLQLVWSFLPPVARTAFLDAYGRVSDATLLRARVLAFSLSAALASYGRDQRMAAVEREAVSSLRRAATD
jgi:aminoglycoside phosphotransferase (APT) family kinase protein